MEMRLSRNADEKWMPREIVEQVIRIMKTGASGAEIALFDERIKEHRLVEESEEAIRTLFKYGYPMSKMSSDGGNC